MEWMVAEMYSVLKRQSLINKLKIMDKEKQELDEEMGSGRPSLYIRKTFLN